MTLSDDGDTNRSKTASNLDTGDDSSGRSLFVDVPIMVTTNHESNETDDLAGIINNEDVLLSKNDTVAASKSMYSNKLLKRCRLIIDFRSIRNEYRLQ